MDRPSRAPLYLGVVLVVCGWVAIGLGWWRAGQQDLETGQIPFMISGGFGGFGLLLMGAVSVLIDFVRQSEWLLRRSAEVLHDRMEQVLDSLPTRRAASPAMTDRASPRPRRRRRRPRGQSAERPT